MARNRQGAGPVSVMRPLLLLPLAFMCFGASPAAAQQLGCFVEAEDAHGRWEASTTVLRRGNTTTASGDYYEWEPSEPVQVAGGISMTYGLAYAISRDDKDWQSVAPNEVTVDISFAFNAAEIGHELDPPSVSWLHLYRNWSAARDPGSTATSLINQMFWNRYANGNASTRTVIVLEDLLAFGSGRDDLALAIRSSPDTAGLSRILLRARLPIAQLRNRIDAIPDLRRRLAEKVASFETSCDPVATVSVP